MAAYATYSDVEQRWGKVFTQSEIDRANVLLDDIAVYLDSELAMRGVDPQSKLAELKIVSCNIAQRIMASPTDSVSVTSETQTAGPYSHTWNYDFATLSMYLKRADKVMLGLIGGMAMQVQVAVHDCDGVVIWPQTE